MHAPYSDTTGSVRPMAMLGPPVAPPDPTFALPLMVNVSPAILTSTVPVIPIELKLMLTGPLSDEPL